MLETTPRREESLGEFIATRARRVSDARLAGDAISAGLAALAIGVWRGPLWDVRIAIAICLLAFGIWGVADRDVARRGDAPQRALLVPRTARVVAGVLGFGALAYVMISLLGRAIGRVIS